MTTEKKVTVQLVRSPIGCAASHRATVRGLGLRKIRITRSVIWSRCSERLMMELNGIKPADGAKHYKRRVGRGIGSGLGKTAGRGHKGQKSRAGGYHKVVPKRGFKSALLKFNAEVTLGALNLLDSTEINLSMLKQTGLVGELAKVVKIIKTGEVTKAFNLSGIGATAAAKLAIEAAGGSLA